MRGSVTLVRWALAVTAGANHTGRQTRSQSHIRVAMCGGWVWVDSQGAEAAELGIGINSACLIPLQCVAIVTSLCIVWTSHAQCHTNPILLSCSLWVVHNRYIVMC